MTMFKVYKLHFTSPVHFGNVRSDYGISLTTVQSDTMYAAITSCLAKLGLPIPEDGDLGCTISSLFPFHQKDKTGECTYFFPRPLKAEVLEPKVVESAKRVKKVAWLDRDYFERAIKGETLFSSENSVSDIKAGQYLSSKAIMESTEDGILTSLESPRVKVPNDPNKDSEPFYMERVFFNDRSGLFFLAEGNTELIDKGMALLQHEGIGTDRNVGNGAFEYEKAEISIEIPKDCNYAVSLSVFIPESSGQLQSMLSGERIGYELSRRGGWITSSQFSNLRKNAISAFSAGSVFSLPDAPCHKGAIVDLAPDAVTHPIWRSGRAMFIPIKL